MNRLLVTGGIVLILGVVTFFVGQSTYNEGYKVAMWKSATRGESQMQRGKITKFSGLGIGAIGGVVSVMAVARQRKGS